MGESVPDVSWRKLSGMSNFLQTTPFMQVPRGELEAAVAFFRDLLGFKEFVHYPDYAYLDREGCGIRIGGYNEAEDTPRGRRNFRYYFDVRDVDALYAELKPKLDELPKGDVHGPADKSYGERELLILAPDGDLVCFGQSIFMDPRGQEFVKRDEVPAVG
jgi:catechol 2,3-dioxygenase-like lactoylglutathione lyase family enzyme